MPTPTGRPKVGEYIVTPKGIRGKVVQRGMGESYNVWIRWPPQPGRPPVTIVTGFELHKKRQGWIIVSTTERTFP